MSRRAAPAPITSALSATLKIRGRGPPTGPWMSIAAAAVIWEMSGAAGDP